MITLEKLLTELKAESFNEIVGGGNPCKPPKCKPPKSSSNSGGSGCSTRTRSCTRSSQSCSS